MAIHAAASHYAPVRDGRFGRSEIPLSKLPEQDMPLPTDRRPTRILIPIDGH